MLLGHRATPRERVRRVLYATFVACAPAVLWYVLASFGVIDWPQSSGLIGVGLGVLGAVIIFFELALAPRKWLRRIRRLGPARVWMKWHIWLGLAVLPIIVIHSGFKWGGLLSLLTMVFFLIVIVSGIYGLILQQVLPRKLFDEVPSETVASQVDQAIAKPIEDANAVVYKSDSPALEAFYEKHLAGHLKSGRKSGSLLASPTEAARLFARLRQSLPKDLEAATYKLEKLAELRRQWDRQVRLNWWLHSWLVVHLPLSVLMVGFMIIHAVLAMKWW